MAFHLSFCILIIVLCSTSIAQGCVERERAALLDFKKSFTSFPQSNELLSSWNISSQDCCGWQGIFCDDSGVHVVEVFLGGQDLESQHLRPSLLELQHLTHLFLGENNFSMRIPEFIGSFKELSYLDLSYAGFFGSVPPQLANLSRLEILDLGGVDFSEARDWLSIITKLPLLSYFVCESCSFPTPDTLPTTGFNSSSSHLQILVLSNSLISSSTLSFLLNTSHQLKSIDLDSVDWQVPSIDLFDQIGTLCNLELLYIESCSIKHSFSRVIQALGSGCAAASLSKLELTSNTLTGSIPPMLMFPSLTELYLQDNQLEGFATHSSAIQSPNSPQESHVSSTNTTHIFPENLSTLIISNNKLSGVFLSEYFVNISHLDVLDISFYPNLTVSFTEPPREVREINLQSCNLGPGFPTWLIGLKNVEYLDIAESNISGYIPKAFWGNLSSDMYHLNLSNNNLLGTIPNLQPFSYQNPNRNLQHTIDLSSNGFYGSLPQFLFSASYLFLSKNNFSSFSPFPHHNISPYFNILDISDNNLSGEIPNLAWITISQFKIIDLSNNNLSGRVPNLNTTKNVYVLNLSNNKFFGQIPSFLKNSTSMIVLDLSQNRFSGLIPYWIGEDLKSLVVVSLQSNNFIGTLPNNLCHLRSLRVLDLSHNKFSGIIPLCVNNFFAMSHGVQWENEVAAGISPKSLTEVNSFVTMGKEVYYSFVPMVKAWIKWKGTDQLFHKNLDLLSLIDLSYNHLSGEIPRELMSLISLDSLDLSSNNFTGSIPSQIGQLKSLEYLNLSFNSLSGPIPLGLADITSIGVLDLSHNKLSGRIPKGSQLQTFDSSSFTANSGLCGEPLEVKCPGDPDDSTQPLQPPPEATHEDDERGDMQWFYAGSGAGFACGFLGIIATLTWIKEWRYAFFRFATELGEWMLLVVALGVSRISRKLRFK